MYNKIYNNIFFKKMFIFHHFLIFHKTDKKYQLILFTGDNSLKLFTEYWDNFDRLNGKILFTFHFITKTGIYINNLCKLLYNMFGDTLVVIDSKGIINASEYQNVSLSFYKIFQLFDTLINFYGCFYYFSGHSIATINALFRSLGITIYVNPKHVKSNMTYIEHKPALKEVHIVSTSLKLYHLIRLISLLVSHYKKKKI